MKIAIIGTGYVGLVTGACFAHWGHSVICVDKDDAKIANLKGGILPIYEPGLDTLVAANQITGRLSFSCALPSALESVDVVFIAVGTPPRERDGEADVSFVYQVAREIAAALRGDAVVVIKSTVPVGTASVVERIFAATDCQAKVTVVSNPEFLREGSAIDDFLSPDRVVIGVEQTAAAAVMRVLYAEVERLGIPLILTDRRTAELTKYAANAFLATKIAFINEIADLCEHVGADVMKLAIGVGLDQRIGEGFLSPGPGYGGSCFPKDTLALLRTAQEFGVTLRLVEETVATNDARKRKMALRVAAALGGGVAGCKIAVLGLTFKANTDDMREAPSIPLICALQRGGASINAYDPAGMKHAKHVFEDVAFLESAYECAQDADAVVLVTDWDCFKTLDLVRLRAAMRGDVFVDLRNIIAAQAAEMAGLRLTSLGVKSRHAGGSGYAQYAPVGVSAPPTNRDIANQAVLSIVSMR
jgi:UDPglucose 6-dehydrogenase